MRKLFLFITVTLIFSICFAACTSPTSPKTRGGGGDDGGGTDGPTIEPEEDEPYEGVMLRVGLKCGEELKEVETPEGVAIIGKFGFGGASDSTVWVKEECNESGVAPGDVELIPYTSGSVFVPWTNLPGEYNEIVLISNSNQFTSITNSGGGIDGTKNKIFILTEDLDVSGNWNNQAVGNDSAKFQGWFHGGGRTIKKLTLSPERVAALFGVVQNARIENLRVTASNAQDLKSSGDTYISPVVGKVVGSSIGDAGTVIRRIAVSMDESKNSVISIGEPQNDKKVFFGGIVASITSSSPTRVEECAVYLRVDANTALSESTGIDARISVGGIVGDIESDAQVTIINNYSIGTASIYGNAQANSAGNANNYPKFAGGIVGFIGKTTTSQNAPSVVAYNYTQFDIDIDGGVKVNPSQNANIFRGAGGIVGAKTQSKEGTNEYVNVYKNYVMTKTISCNSKWIRRVIANKTPNSPNGTIVCQDEGGESFNNVYSGIKLKDAESKMESNEYIGDKAEPILDGNSDVRDDMFLSKQSYELADWDFVDVWAMGSDATRYSMASLIGIKTADTKIHYGGYPYPVLKWTGVLIPYSLDFEPIAYLKFDAEGYDPEGYDMDGYHRETGLNREGYDKWGVYGGIADGSEYYSYEPYETPGAYQDLQELQLNYTAPVPGFSWSPADYYSGGVTSVMEMGDWSKKDQPDLIIVPIPKSHGQIGEGDASPSPPAKGDPLPWVDREPADGYDDVLGLDKNGFSKDGGLNLYGYEKNGRHSGGYDNTGTYNGVFYETGLDIYGLPCPWIDEDNDGYNDITGLNNELQLKPGEE
ncbi:MAG: hypothetical protein LBC53_02465 [Spirochaetaceae bacterium]|jgi:hypothetical protein|nr:hypothetical protein [Spirochaetaceae bacterium]